VIFRRLYRRKLLRLFGPPLIHPSDVALLEKLAAEISEWQALRSFLPMRWFHSQDEIADALSQVARLAAHCSREPDILAHVSRKQNRSRFLRCHSGESRNP
jgi:hypothetical protein